MDLWQNGEFDSSGECFPVCPLSRSVVCGSLFTKDLVSLSTLFKERVFYNSAITQPLVCARIVVEIGSHLTKRVTVESHNCFLDQRS